MAELKNIVRYRMDFVTPGFIISRGSLYPGVHYIPGFHSGRVLARTLRVEQSPNKHGENHASFNRKDSFGKSKTIFII